MTSGVSNKDINVPASFPSLVGKGRLEKGGWSTGKDASIHLVVWDYVSECTGEKCPLYNTCEYKKKWDMRPENAKNTKNAKNKALICKMELNYLKNVMFAVMEKLEGSIAKKEVNRENVIKLGYSLVPLYSQLFKFKVWEYQNKEVVIFDGNMNPKVHPIYKEIREIIKTINGMWKEIGARGKKLDADKVGDSSFIDAMYSVEEGDHSSDDSNSSSGVGIDLDDNDTNDTDTDNSDEGNGIDFQEAGVPDEEPKKKSTYKPKYNKKKYKKKKKRAYADVLPFNSPKRKELENG